jgi:hypothetical protein
MSRPPPVSHVARTHWVVGVMIAFFVAVLHAMTFRLPIAFGTKSYAIALSLAALYLAGGTLVWFGLPFGRFVSRVCGLLYLARPDFGSHLWRLMDAPEYRAHFVRGKHSAV